MCASAKALSLLCAQRIVARSAAYFRTGASSWRRRRLRIVWAVRRFWERHVSVPSSGSRRVSWMRTFCVHVDSTYGTAGRDGRAISFRRELIVRPLPSMFFQRQSWSSARKKTFNSNGKQFQLVGEAGFFVLALAWSF